MSTVTSDEDLSIVRFEAEEAVDPHAPQQVVEFVDHRPLRLDLACGSTPIPGFVGVDFHAPGAMKVDLFKFPWPWADDSVEALHCSHFVEHLPMCFVVDGELRHTGAPHEDFFFKFFDECYRILKPGGSMEVVVPYLQSVRAFQDPTHRRFLSEANFMYLDADWRNAVGLTHYGVKCDFSFRTERMSDPFEGLRHGESAAYRQIHNWNVVSDVRATLVKKAPVAEQGT